MKVIFRQKGASDLEVKVFTEPALKHITKLMIKWCETNLPDWAEIIYEPDFDALMAQQDWELAKKLRSKIY